MKRHYNIPVFLPHAACPFRCVFCDQHLITAQKNVPSPQEVNGILRETLSTIPEGAEVEAAFFGGSFTALDAAVQESYLAVVQPWLASGRIQSIRVSTRPDCIDEETLQRLARYHVKVIELGVQSFDAEVLRASGRGYTPETAEAACRSIREAGFLLGVQLMPGLPQDTLEKCMASARKTVELRADMVRIYPTVVLKGTALARMMADGRYEALSVERAVEIAKEMRLLFDRAQIPVIRLGLYAGEDLQNAENICGGAFHPALGELVEQKIFLEQTEMLLEEYRRTEPAAAPLVFYVNRRDLSKFMGQKRKNRQMLQKKCGGCAMRIQGIETNERDWVGIGPEGIGQPVYRLTRTEYLKRKETDGR